ncbi:TPA: SHOCT domain-containing protein [Clostridioides difficile]|nr:SHOCT domain-containing protein [Clostridioides difficile]HBG1232736.1 SHOCT domain-containing protein [Clostridioides difficile]
MNFFKRKDDIKNFKLMYIKGHPHFNNELTCTMYIDKKLVSVYTLQQVPISEIKLLDIEKVFIDNDMLIIESKKSVLYFKSNSKDKICNIINQNITDMQDKKTDTILRNKNKIVKQGVMKMDYYNSVGVPNCRGEAISIIIDNHNACLVIENKLLKEEKMRIKFSDLYSVNKYSEKEIAYNNKSVVGRAAIGTLFGPMGTIVGGLSGTGNKKSKTEKLFISIEYFSHGELREIIAEDSILNFHSQEFIDNIRRKINISKNNLENNKEKQIKSNDDAIQQVKGLKELLDMGAITDEEFNKKKKELLNL